MVDKVRPLKIEEDSCGTDINFLPTEVDASEDYITAKGYSFECKDVTLIDTDVNDEMCFQDPEVTTPLKLKEIDDAVTLSGKLVISELFTHNGNVADGTYLGRNENINGLGSPVLVVGDFDLVLVQFSNNRATADYSLLFRRNDPFGTPFLTISKTNTQFFVFPDTGPAVQESFNSGDRLYIQYQDDGQNARDVQLVCYFVPRV